MTGSARPSFVALLLITGTAALATDTYIAALPELQRSLGTTSAVAQLTMTACIAGMAIGQLLSGPISDARGRRRPILLATIVFAGTSIICALALDGWVLVATRVLQGAACGTAAAVGRAVVTDAFAPREAAAKFGTLSAIGLLAPIVGPVIGGLLLTVGSWRSIFWFLAVVGIAMIIAALTGLPETLPPARRHRGGLRTLRLNAAGLLRIPGFGVAVVAQCLTVGGFFVYIGGSSFVLQEGMGLSAQGYTVVFATNAAGMMLSSVAYRLLVLRFGPVLLRRVGVAIQTAAIPALFVTATAWSGAPPLPVVAVCLCGMTIGLGTYFPSNSSIVQHLGRRSAGTASAFGGGIPFLVGALTTPLTGLIGSDSVEVMAAAMFVFFAAAAIVGLVGEQRSSVASADELAELRGR